uniref:PUM-HD domain-containing protein n=1 Tax=Noctiluca scintillans TaxID=2966 RepID=A0A7S0ZXQ9_NOCSC|mmetsp:Transcript_23491/g.61779  ORF Transcript_23491/g.61779 Transcript_23491/m.61779 type:complete len:412 (+) Transcript_23491:73-1308(+)
MAEVLPNSVCRNVHATMPAKALKSRLKALSHRPSWACWLPQELQEEFKVTVTDPPDTAGTCGPPVTAHVSQNPISDDTFSPCGGDKLAGRVSETIPFKFVLGPGLHDAARNGQELWPDSVRSVEQREAPPAPLMPSSVSSVFGRVWKLSRDPQGCREVQRAFDDAGCDSVRVSLAEELRGHVWDCLRDPSGNHVVQKCIVTMRPQASQFILDELRNTGPRSFVAVAKHQYGCRIVERLLEHCHPLQVQMLTDEIMSEALSLCKHPYGNYVVQHLLEHGKDVQKHFLTNLMAAHARSVGSDFHASAVVTKALICAAPADSSALARALLCEDGLIPAMARTRHGHTSVQAILHHLDSPERDEAVRQLMPHFGDLQTSRYGRNVASCFAPLPQHPTSNSQTARVPCVTTGSTKC